MTLTIELTLEEQTRLERAAQAQGKPVEALLRAFIAQLPDDNLPHRTLRGYGKYAHSPRSVEDFHRDRQADRERENREEMA